MTLPEQKILDVKLKFARWMTSTVTKHIHPDKFVSEPLAKQLEMQAVSMLCNKIVNKLKGHA